MAIYSGMFNSVNGDRKYNAWWFALYFSRFIGDGVFPNPSTGLQVLANENMTTVVRPGDGWIKGYFIHNDSDFVLQHNLADGVLKRIDRIVMRLDFQAREIRIEIKKGAFASKPVAPALQRDGDAYELALADVLINNGTTQISQAHITDTRLNKELCGIVKGTVEEVDTTTIFNQYQDWLQTQIDFYEGDFLAWTDDKKVEFEAWRTLRETDFDTWQAQEKSDFDAWFLTIQDILDGDVASNLLNQINNLQQQLNNHEIDDERHTTQTEKNRWNAKETPQGALKQIERTDYKVIKTDKDSEGIFQTVEFRRDDDTLAIKSTLSGGEPPLYITRTLEYYSVDGLTVEKTTTRSLSYDEDDVLISEV